MNELSTIDNNTSINAYHASSFSTILPEDKETTKIIANAINAADSLNDYRGDSLSVIGVICRPGIRGNEAGEVPCTDTTLVTEDGHAYFTKSEGIRRSIENLKDLGVFESGDPVQLKIETLPLGGGRTLKRVRMI